MKMLGVLFSGFTCIAIMSFVLTGNQYQPVPGSAAKFTIDGFLGMDVGGQFSNLKAQIRFDELEPSKSQISASVDVGTISTGIEKRDTHLKSVDFFDALRYPTILFVSSKIEKVGEKNYRCIGLLTIKDVTKEISFPFSIEQHGSGLAFIGGFELNRLDYHVGKKRAGVGNKTRVELNIETVKLAE